MGKLVALGLVPLALAGWMASRADVTQDPIRRGGGQGQSRARDYPLPTNGWAEGSLLLGNPTDRSVECVIHLKSDADAYLEFGATASALDRKSSTVALKAGVPTNVKLTGLKPGALTYYRLRFKKTGQGQFETGPTYQVQTQRRPGDEFMFFVQGDSHPERVPKMHVPALYERILLTAASQKPDFLVCMGDDFSVDTLRERTQQTVEGAYKKQVPYLGLVAHSAPIFLVNGNHEQAAKANLDGTPNSLGVWAQTARNRMFAQPAPDDFYSGNVEPVEHIGLLRNYFAWTWGDALFVTIDPYWHSDSAVDNAVGSGPANGGRQSRDLWDITLGDAQYKWLTKTLVESKAKYKFVFAHHVHGTGRGGIEQAPYYEWGGQDPRKGDIFSEKRPGWELPIHQLFVKTGVTIFFQGHDHIFCRQELDGVIYQTCPCPADPSNSLLNGDAYRSGQKIEGAGLVRVTVGPQATKVDFVRAYEPSAETDSHKHGEIALTYSVPAPARGEE